MRLSKHKVKINKVTIEGGAVQDRYEYDAFGKPYSGDLSGMMNLGYTSKPYDTVTGLYDYGFRDYKPQAARFTTLDPIRDGSNWFVYVNNDPVNYVDKWGLEAESSSNSVGNVPNPEPISYKNSNASIPSPQGIPYPTSQIPDLTDFQTNNNNSDVWESGEQNMPVLIPDATNVSPIPVWTEPSLEEKMKINEMLSGRPFDPSIPPTIYPERYRL